MQLPMHFMPGVDRDFLQLPSQGKIRAGYLSGIKGLVLSKGADPRDVLEHQEIDPSVLDDPDNDLECISVVNLLEYCSSVFNDPLFGLHLAEQQEPDAYGCVIALARAAPNFREALRCLVEYTPLSTSPECEMEMLSAREVMEVRWRTHIGLGNAGQTSYHGVLLMMKILKMLGRDHFRPRYVNLSSRIGRTEVRLLQDKLGCRVNENTHSNGIAFSTDILDRPVITANRTLFNLLDHSLSQLRSTARGDFVEQVEATVRRLLSSGHCSVDACATSLGTSTRTLQKRLTRLRYKFSDIVQNERIKLAKQALLWTDCTLDELAFQLGYSEQTSFGRAFKRCTGMSPNAFRAAERKNQGKIAGGTVN